MHSRPGVEAVYRDVTRAAALGLLVNVTLGVAKLVGGLVGNSFALLSDSVNSLGDVVGAIIVLFAVRVAQLPPDAEHPYGHTRAEGIAATNAALLIVVSALLIGWEAIQRLGVPYEDPQAWTLWLAGLNVVIKEGLYRYNMRVGRRTGSQATLAGAWDHRADAFCSLAVLLGLAAVRFGGRSLWWADVGAALVVVVAILWSAGRLFRNSASELMDVQASDDFVQRIRTSARSVPGVRDIEKLWVRKSGLEYFVDIHIEVDPHMTVAEGHTIGHAVKRELMDEFPTLRDVLVHLEPHG